MSLPCLFLLPANKYATSRTRCQVFSFHAASARREIAFWPVELFRMGHRLGSSHFPNCTKVLAQTHPRKDPDVEHKAYCPSSSPEAVTQTTWGLSRYPVETFLVPKMQHGERLDGTDNALPANSAQVKDFKEGNVALIPLQDTDADVVRNCTGGNPGSWGVVVTPEPGMEQVPVPVLVPVPTIPESVATTGSVPSPQPEHKPTSRAARNTSPKISIRMTSPLGSENVFAMSLSPSCKQICHVPDEVSSF